MVAEGKRSIKELPGMMKMFYTWYGGVYTSILNQNSLKCTKNRCVIAYILYFNKVDSFLNA